MHKRKVCHREIKKYWLSSKNTIDSNVNTSCLFTMWLSWTILHSNFNQHKINAIIKLSSVLLSVSLNELVVLILLYSLVKVQIDLIHNTQHWDNCTHMHSTVYRRHKFFFQFCFFSSFQETNSAWLLLSRWLIKVLISAAIMHYMP